ncbi:MAG: Unknown protein [uncultured Sulfurovum sp.]|uniref:Thioredoxin-like fold domain-containing protein n=1 Tax=uncultured Sulfurovum sp. TaxID=269237 RepID=A0A6S6SSX0_9BACT|nr:MAG: Unknown protein [uncultured Sulfurovum sp.]
MSTSLKFLLFFSLFFFIFSCSSPEETSRRVNEKTSEIKANIPEKITMLFVTQPSCPSCDQLEEVMELSKPKALISKYFKIKKIYLGEKLPDGLMEPNGTPTVYFLGSDNEVLVEPIIGEKKEAALMEFLKDALFEFKNTYNVDLVEKFNNQKLTEHHETLTH